MMAGFSSEPEITLSMLLIPTAVSVGVSIQEEQLYLGQQLRMMGHSILAQEINFMLLIQVAKDWPIAHGPNLD